MSPPVQVSARIPGTPQRRSGYRRTSADRLPRPPQPPRLVTLTPPRLHVVSVRSKSILARPPLLRLHSADATTHRTVVRSAESADSRIALPYPTNLLAADS